jgi:hypothetical protein
MIQTINSKLNEYLEFDNDLLFFDPLVRIFGGAIRDCIADQPINDIDILCGAHSASRLEYILEQNGYYKMNKLTSIDMATIYKDIKVISEPVTWMKGKKIVQIIRPRLINGVRLEFASTLSKQKAYVENFKQLISNVDLTPCGVSWNSGILYENCQNAVIHCLMKSFYVNSGAAMYSYDRIIHRKHKLLDRGWTEVEANTVEDRDLKIDYLLGNDTSVEFIKEWGYAERPSIIK